MKKLAALCGVLAAVLLGANLLWQAAGEGLSREDIPETQVDVIEQRSAGWRYRDAAGREMAVEAHLRRTKGGQAHQVAATISVGGDPLPYRIANLQIHVLAGGEAYDIAANDLVEVDLDAPREGAIDYAFSTELSDWGEGNVQANLIFQMEPETAPCTAAWTYDIRRKNILGWTVARAESIGLSLK